MWVHLHYYQRNACRFDHLQLIVGLPEKSDLRKKKNIACSLNMLIWCSINVVFQFVFKKKKKLKNLITLYCVYAVR